LSPSRSGINSADKEAYYREELRTFQKQVKIPQILVGGNRSFDIAEQLVNMGSADYISMSRPFIREPDLIARWKPGTATKRNANRTVSASCRGLRGKVSALRDKGT
jgi:2,4-dienoyl-CoA reductase-like NADH-dependent reductase (Old Yellow Enzyme family)